MQRELQWWEQPSTLMMSGGLSRAGSCSPDGPRGARDLWKVFHPKSLLLPYSLWGGFGSFLPGRFTIRRFRVPCEMCWALSWRRPGALLPLLRRRLSLANLLAEAPEVNDTYARKSTTPFHAPTKAHRFISSRGVPPTTQFNRVFGRFGQGSLFGQRLCASMFRDEPCASDVQRIPYGTAQRAPARFAFGSGAFATAVAAAGVPGRKAC